MLRTRGNRRVVGRLSMKGSFLVACALLCASGVLMTPLGASASSAKKSKSGSCTSANGIKFKDNPSVCKGLAFYRGQTLTFVEPGSVGGAFDLQAIAEIPGLESFLGANINELRITTGSSIPGQDYLAAATPTGLTIGLLNPLNDASLLLEGTSALNFNPARMAYLSGGGPAEDALIVNSSAGATTFGGFLATAKAGTAKNITEATGTTVTIFRTLMAATGGITSVASPEWVTGFTSTSQEVMGFVQHDGSSMYIPLGNECSLIEGGQATAIMTTFVPPVGTLCRKYLTGVPTLADLAKTYGTTKASKKMFSTLRDLLKLTGLPTATQTSVAGYKIQALRAALQWDYRQPTLKSTMLASDIDPVYQNPVEAKQFYIDAITAGKSVACYLVAGVACS